MDRAAVPTYSDLRKVENILFLENIHEISNSIPPKEPLPSKVTTSDSHIPEAEEA